MSQLITINSVSYDGELATILFKPDNSNDVINFGVVTLPFVFNSGLLTPPRDVYGSYTILVDGSDCSKIMNVPRPTPTPTPTVTPTRTVTPTPTTTPTPTPTNDPCPTKTPTPTPTSTPQPTRTPTRTPTPTPTSSPCKTPTPTPTPTTSLLPSPSGIYFGKFSGSTITSGDVSTFTFVLTNNPTNSYVTFQTGSAYGYILIPILLSQPTGFRDSDAGCSGFNIPINNIGTIIIIDGNGFPITYNIYRTFYPFFGDTDCWLCN
jgi:hypothetical protein